MISWQSDLTDTNLLPRLFRHVPESAIDFSVLLNGGPDSDFLKHSGDFLKSVHDYLIQEQESTHGASGSTIPDIAGMHITNDIKTFEQ